MNARYKHANTVAGDWRRLADSYQDVFGCRPVPPPRELAGPWLEQGAGVPDNDSRSLFCLRGRLRPGFRR